MLRRLAELGMIMAERVARRAVAADEAAQAAEADPEQASAPAPEPRHDPAASFCRLARMVRFTLALEAKMEDQIAAIVAGPAEAQAMGVDETVWLPPHKPPVDYPSAYRNKIRDSVYFALNEEIDDIPPAREALDALYERLWEGEKYDEFVFHLPFKEAVAAICDDLGLQPDWSRWTEDGFPGKPDTGSYKAWEMMWAPKWMPPILRRPAGRIRSPSG